MQRKFGLLFVTLLIGLLTAQTALASSGPAPYIVSDGGSPATTITSYNLSCTSLTIAGNSPAPYVDIQVYTYNPSSTITTVFPVSGGSYSATVIFPAQPTGAYFYFYAWGAPTSTPNDFNYKDYSAVDLATCPASFAQAVGVTWFNPGDGRINGQPGDRIAVWCNTAATPPNIVVYGVGDNATNGSHGFWLATFTNADLLKAGKAGITKNGGAGNGTISAMQDGNGNFWIAWNGGLFNATGNPPFAKSFSCQF